MSTDMGFCTPLRLAFALIAISNAACGASDSNKFDVQGRVEKGPFRAGSTVRVETLDRDLQSAPLRDSFTFETSDPDGAFTYAGLAAGAGRFPSAGAKAGAVFLFDPGDDVPVLTLYQP